MPRYTFRIIVGSVPLRGARSAELDDIEVVVTLAGEMLDAEARAAPGAAVQVEVRDGEGRHVHTVVTI